jgi:methylglyoxal synthase
MPTIALIAHDAKKDDLLELVLERRAQLATFTIVATNTTGTLIEKAGLEVRKMLSGPLGGDLQIGALTATGEIDAMIFLRDPLTAHPHEPDIAALMKVCDIHNVPLATNIATAKILLDGCQSQHE